MLNSKQRAYLRGMANDMDAIFQIGKGGISENLIKQVDDALAARELIKLTVLETAELSAREACDRLCAATEAEGVQVIGRKLVMYRANKEKIKKGEGIILP